ncbi:MAG: PRC-barrel domain-containing protein [Dehalococcoidia bacterium]
MTMSGSYTGAMPATGTEVYTADGDRLGKVKEVMGDCFKVDASMRPDYWLARDCITSSSGNDVRLGFSKSQLGDKKMGNPTDKNQAEMHTGVHTHTDSVV